MSARGSERWPEVPPGNDSDPVIIAARRTPIGRAGGGLRGLQAFELLAPVLRAVLDDVPGGWDLPVDDVIAGNAVGGGGNVARLAALQANLPFEVPGLTVDRQCGSGLEAVNLACRLVAAGAGEVYVAGGTESVSTAPARAHRSADGTLDFFERARFSTDAIGDPDVGTAAENVAAAKGISRARQDAFAHQSHQRALVAQAGKVFDRELVPLGALESDEGPRKGLTPALLARFPAAFVSGGSVTAGNSCPYSDGAAAVVVVSRAVARRLGIAAGLVFVDSAVTGCDPNLLGMGAAGSTLFLLRRQGLDLETLAAPGTLIEFNEAFAAQVLAVLDELGLRPEDINSDGGALALGHPYGASGAVSVTRLLARARSGARPGSLALAMVSIAGGMGISSLFRWEVLPKSPAVL